MARLFLLLAACSLAACTDSSPTSTSLPTDVPFGLSADGVGDVGAATPFDSAAVQAALPAGFAIERQSALTDDGEVPVLWALRDGRLALEIFGDETVSRIDVVTDDVPGPDGVQTGQSFADADGASMRCEPGEDGLSGRVVCRQGRGDAVSYVFADADAVGGEVPSDDDLADGLLERMVWRAE